MGSVKRSARRQLHPIGQIRSELRSTADAPMQGVEGAPDAWLEINRSVRDAIRGLSAGDEVIVLTWFHRADRRVVQTHPRSDPNRPLTGVFATRSPDRPNPIGLHRVTIRAIDAHRIRIGPIEAIDRTPVIDIKPVLGRTNDA